MTAEFGDVDAVLGGLTAADPDDGQVLDANIDRAADRESRAVSRVEQHSRDACAADAQRQRTLDRDTLPERVAAGADADRPAARLDDLLHRVLDRQNPRPVGLDGHAGVASASTALALALTGQWPDGPAVLRASLVAEVQDREPAVVVVDPARWSLDQLVDRRVHGPSGEHPVVA